MPLNRDAITIAWKHHRAGDDRRAEHLCRQLLAAQPDEPELHFLFGTIAHTLGRSEEAAASFRRAFALKPDYPEAHNNLGNALAALSQFAEAEACYQFRPAYPEAQNNLGNVLRWLKRDEEAAASFQRALELRPEYAWRQRLHGTPSHPLPQPLWDGETLAGRTILLEAEATLGETIQFARFAALAKAQGARVALECPARWVPLLTRCRGIDQVVARGEAAREALAKYFCCELKSF